MALPISMSAPGGRIAVACCAAASMVLAALPASATTPPVVGPRILVQAGLNLMQSFNLLESEIDVIDNFQTTPPECSVEGYGGSVKTLSSQKVSSTVTQAQIDVYFDRTCTKPYLSANVTVTYSQTEEVFSVSVAGTYYQPDGQTLATLKANDKYDFSNKVATFSSVGTLTPVGGQPAADIGIVCSEPTTGNSKSLQCEAGVAQTFRSLNMSLASVQPFILTASNPNLSHPSVQFSGSSSNMRTGTAGSLSLTQPTAMSIGIRGGGTDYTTTKTAGSEAHFALFPPAPTAWTVTDAAHNSKFSFHIVNTTGDAGLATVTTISPPSTLATVSVDKSGTGNVKYSDGRSALIRAWLVAD